MWKIYKHIFPNGKIYIGQTGKTCSQRFANGEGYRKCPFIYNAIKKYGWKNVKTEIIHDEILTLDEANELEKYYINLYDARNPDVGYNIAEGGGIVKTVNYEEILKKWNEGYCVTEIGEITGHDRHVVSDILKNYDIPEQEIKERGIEAYAKQHRKYNYEDIYNYWLKCRNCKQTTDYFKCNYDTLQRVFKFYNVSKEERRIYQKQNLHKCITGYNQKRVLQYDLFDNYIQSFSSLREAARFIGKNEISGARRISQACKKENHTAYNFKWKFSEESN